MNIEPQQIIAGLAHADRESLCTLIALYEETYLQKIVLDMFKDAGSWMAKKVKEKVKETVKKKAPKPASEEVDLKKAERKKAFERRLAEKSASLAKEDISIETLRLRLWMHLREGLGLSPQLTFFRVGAAKATEDIAEKAREIFAKQLDDDEVKKVKFFSKEYWTDYAKVRLNPFSKKCINDPTFSDVIKLNTLRIIASAAERGDLPSELQDELTQKVRDLVARMDSDTQRELLAQFEADELSESTALQILMGASGLFGLGITVELAGLAAYVLAANTSAVVPLLGGNSLIGTTAVLANPLFIVPVVLLGGVFIARNLKKRVRQAFGIAVSTILVLRAIAENKLDPEPALVVFRDVPKFLPAEIVSKCESLMEKQEQEREKAEKQELKGKDKFKKVAKKFGLWAKAGFVSDEYPNAVGYLQRFLELEAGGKEGDELAAPGPLSTVGSRPGTDPNLRPGTDKSKKKEVSKVDQLLAEAQAELDALLKDDKEETDPPKEPDPEPVPSAGELEDVSSELDVPDLSDDPIKDLPQDKLPPEWKEQDQEKQDEQEEIPLDENAFTGEDTEPDADEN